MSSKHTLKQKAEDAAVAYLGRLGMTVVERDWKGKTTIQIVALDGDILVFVRVTSRRVGTEFSGLTKGILRDLDRAAKAYMEENNRTGQYRIDRIDLFVVAEDRALLRHHRDVTAGQRVK